DNEDVGTVGPETGLFTAVAVGETIVTLTDGTSSVTASVFVYDEAAGGVQVIADELEIAQGETTGVRIVPDSGTYDVPPPEEVAGELDHAGTSLGTLENLVESPWEGRYVAGDAIGKIRITATDTGTNPEETTSAVITVLPATPTKLAANNDTGSPNSIQLSWEHTAGLPVTTTSPDPDAGFEIFRASSDNATMASVGKVTSAEHSFLDTNVLPSVNYYIYEIVAFTPNFTSRPSDPSAPTTSKP
ncbi:MAG: fibronectin type III domain-containing protein, partial [Spirochaetota bacterium]